MNAIKALLNKINPISKSRSSNFELQELTTQEKLDSIRKELCSTN